VYTASGDGLRQNDHLNIESMGLFFVSSEPKGRNDNCTGTITTRRLYVTWFWSLAHGMAMRFVTSIKTTNEESCDQAKQAIDEQRITE